MRVHQMVEPELEAALPFSLTGLVMHVAAIVHHNMTKQRARLAIGYRTTREHTSEMADVLTDVFADRTLLTAFEAYIDRIVVHFLREYDRVRSLAAPDDAAWKQLYEQLTQRSYRVLLRLHVAPDRARSEAPDFSQETCELIFRTYFPFDVPLDAWTTRILTNCILQRYTRSLDVTDRTPMPLSFDGITEDSDEVSFSFFECLSDAAALDPLNQIVVKELLERSIASLRSRAQQQVILGTFFYGMSDAELAHGLQKSVGAVHILRHRALGALQQMMA
jgi:DNA-directed RNA polymerase specialized sigma24 family protein